MTRKQKRTALISGAFIAATAAVGLVLAALNNAVSYFYIPSELAKLTAPPDGIIRLGGLVAPGSVTYDGSDDATVHFQITDEIAETAVSFKGVLPDLFREGQGVVVQGRLDASGGVEAIEVLAKHDENYMPRELTEALKEQGRWRESDAPE